jgi:hypothetical protein
MNDSWSKQAAEQLRERVERQAKYDATQAGDKKLMEEYGPALWQELCQYVNELCKEFNKNYGELVLLSEVAPNQVLLVQMRVGGTMSELTATFNISNSTDTLRWSYHGPAQRTGRAGSYALYVSNGRVTFNKGGHAPAIQSIAQEMLDGLVKQP